MEIANCQLVLNSFKSTVPKTNISPAEAMILQHLHGANAGGAAIVELSVLNAEALKKSEHATAMSKFTSKEELIRLLNKYHSKTVKELFPGALPTLPMTFKDAGVVFVDAPKPKVESSPAPIQPPVK